MGAIRLPRKLRTSNQDWAQRVRRVTAGEIDSVSALLIILVVVDLGGAAPGAYGLALRLHINLELLRRLPALPPVVAVAHPIPLLTQQEGETAAWRQANESQAGQGPAKLRKRIHPHAAKQHGDGNKGIDDRHVPRFDPDDEEHLEFNVAVE